MLGATTSFTMVVSHVTFPVQTQSPTPSPTHAASSTFEPIHAYTNECKPSNSDWPLKIHEQFYNANNNWIAVTDDIKNNWFSLVAVSIYLVLDLKMIQL